MIRRALRSLLLVGLALTVAGMSAGCERNIVTENARTSLSGFLNGLFDAAVNNALFPNKE